MSLKFYKHGIGLILKYFTRPLDKLVNKENALFNTLEDIYKSQCDQVDTEDKINYIIYTESVNGDDTSTSLQSTLYVRNPLNGVTTYLKVTSVTHSDSSDTPETAIGRAIMTDPTITPDEFEDLVNLGLKPFSPPDTGFLHSSSSTDSPSDASDSSASPHMSISDLLVQIILKQHSKKHGEDELALTGAAAAASDASSHISISSDSLARKMHDECDDW